MLSSGLCLFSKTLTCYQRGVIGGPVNAQKMFSGMLLYVRDIKIAHKMVSSNIEGNFTP